MSDSAGASTGSVKHLFPLHLAPIESFMLADDQADYPMTFVVQLTLAGQLDPASWHAALDETLDRHPLLRAVIEPGKGGRLCWRLAEGQAPFVHLGQESETLPLPRGEGLDLSQEIGLRVWARQGSERVQVLLQFHHACVDGTGAYRFIGDLLAAYGRRTATGDQRPEQVDLAPQFLRHRKNRTLAVALHGARGLTPLALRQAWHILVPRPTPLAPPARRPAPGASGEMFPGFLSTSLDRTEHQRFRDTAGRAGVSPNDLLLRDLFLTLARWNEDVGRSARWLRIMMPTDLREGDDIEMPAANLTSYSFLTRRASECREPDALLQTIRQQTALVKSQRLGTVFMDTVYAACHVRGLLPFVMRRNLCLATAVLSNAADPSRRFTPRFPRQAGRLVCGNLILEDITGVPPLRRKTRATVSISQYDRRLTVSLRCDPHLFRLEDSAELLRRYIEQLRTSANSPQRWAL
jgi:hypothetical protein